MKILVLNGPNLNLLGAREESNYGSLTLAEIIDTIISEFPEETFVFYQSNLEWELINKIQKASN